VCNLEENLFSTLILVSVFNDYVVFYEDNQFVYHIGQTKLSVIDCITF